MATTTTASKPIKLGKDPPTAMANVEFPNFNTTSSTKERANRDPISTHVTIPTDVEKSKIIEEEVFIRVQDTYNRPQKDSFELDELWFGFHHQNPIKKELQSFVKKGETNGGDIMLKGTPYLIHTPNISHVVNILKQHPTLAARIVYVPEQLRQPNQDAKALLCRLTLDTQFVDSFWQEFEKCQSTVIYKFLGNPDSASHKPFGNKIICHYTGKIIRTKSDISFQLSRVVIDVGLPPISEVENAKCECCGMCEECTPEYIQRIRVKYSGKWICGLCSEAVKEELEKNGGKGEEEALNSHMNLCVRFNRLGRTHPALYHAEAVKEILKKSPRLDGRVRDKSICPRDVKLGVKAKGGIARSSSCIPAITKEMMNQTVED
ncbi:hypothetical protein GIB67_010143 [Kingdonia uniflora]|uniref:Uncharacterized protein n=1 Tax=Kingdonia uniflora TaxID=39325 RepID=A0A7J7NAQ5_9MAGN|nr:hypothetical protein GIB67_010143 [Kingdonia uniflora]